MAETAREHWKALYRALRAASVRHALPRRIRAHFRLFALRVAYIKSRPK